MNNRGNDYQREQRRKATEEQNDRLLVWLIALAMLILACAQSRMAGAKEGDFGVHTHNGEIGKLYTRWQRPNYRRDSEWNNKTNERYWSCCSEKDCHPVQTRMRDGHWEFLSQHPDYAGQWRRVPNDLVETNYDDAELTPDGRAHACESVYSGEILCFTPGDPEQ